MSFGLILTDSEKEKVFRVLNKRFTPEVSPDAVMEYIIRTIGLWQPGIRENLTHQFFSRIQEDYYFIALHYADASGGYVFCHAFPKTYFEELMVNKQYIIDFDKAKCLHTHFMLYVSGHFKFGDLHQAEIISVERYIRYSLTGVLPVK